MIRTFVCSLLITVTLCVACSGCGPGKDLFSKHPSNSFAGSFNIYDSGAIFRYRNPVTYTMDEDTARTIFFNIELLRGVQSYTLLPPYMFRFDYPRKSFFVLLVDTVKNFDSVPGRLSLRELDKLQDLNILENKTITQTMRKIGHSKYNYSTHAGYFQLLFLNNKRGYQNMDRIRRSLVVIKE